MLDDAEPEPDEIEIWPENWAVYEIWRAMGNRWRVIAGLAGVVYQGLDMAQAESIMRMRGIAPDEQDRISRALEEMEEIAVTAIYES